MKRSALNKLNRAKREKLKQMFKELFSLAPKLDLAQLESNFFELIDRNNGSNERTKARYKQQTQRIFKMLQSPLGMQQFASAVDNQRWATNHFFCVFRKLYRLVNAPSNTGLLTPQLQTTQHENDVENSNAKAKVIDGIFENLVELRKNLEKNGTHIDQLTRQFADYLRSEKKYATTTVYNYVWWLKRVNSVIFEDDALLNFVERVRQLRAPAHSLLWATSHFLEFIKTNGTASTIAEQPAKQPTLFDSVPSEEDQLTRLERELIGMLEKAIRDEVTDQTIVQAKHIDNTIEAVEQRLSKLRKLLRKFYLISESETVLAQK